MTTILDKILETAKKNEDVYVLSHRWEEGDMFWFGQYYDCKCGSVMLAHGRDVVYEFDPKESKRMCPLDERDFMIAEIIE